MRHKYFDGLLVEFAPLVVRGVPAAGRARGARVERESIRRRRKADVCVCSFWMGYVPCLESRVRPSMAALVVVGAHLESFEEAVRERSPRIQSVMTSGT